MLYRFFTRWLFDISITQQRRCSKLFQRTIRVDEFTWTYLDGGNPAGEPVVLIHGFGADKDNWITFVPALSRRFRLIIPDLPGFGESSQVFGSDYRIGMQTARLRAFLDAIGVGKCHLGGNSMGGYIALWFALEHPDRLSSLTLFNNAGVQGTKDSELEQMVKADPSTNPITIRSAADFDRLMAFATHNPRWIPRAFKRVLVERARTRQPMMNAIFAQLITDLDGNMLNDRLDEVAVPTLIIWGRHDRLVDVSCAAILHKNIARSEIAIFEDVGHIPMIEKPGDVARRHLSFLKRHQVAF